MAKSQSHFGKQENEKKRLKKRQEKESKREERQANAKKGVSLDDMLAYVDEDGNISTTPPDPTKKKEIKAEDIVLGAARIEDTDDGDPVRTGTVTFFNTAKGYGFIKDARTQESIFVHANNLGGLTIKENDRVTFEVEPGQKGPAAVRVKMAG